LTVNGSLAALLNTPSEKIPGMHVEGQGCCILQILPYQADVGKRAVVHPAEQPHITPDCSDSRGPTDGP
jgi:hypothetical protein